jgi:hypothetical protein
MEKRFIWTVLLAGLLSACGSSDSSKGVSTSTQTGTTTGTSGTKTFTASCMMVTNIGSGAAAVSITVCHDYYDSSASAIQASCTSKPGDTMAMTYSADHCPTANLQGTCTRPNTGDVDYYYDGGTITKASNQSGCGSSGGTWADPQ